MTPRELIEDLRQRDVSLSIEGNNIKMRGRLGSVTEQDRQLIHTIRESLVQFLSILNLKIGQRVWLDGEPVYVWEVYSSGRVGVIQDSAETEWPRFFDFNEFIFTRSSNGIEFTKI